MPDLHVKFSKQQLLIFVVLALAIYVLVPQFGDFRKSWELLSQPQLGWTLAAIAFAGLTYCAGAGTYLFLAFKPLRYAQVVLVQLAAMFVNRLLPAGIGALGANFVYLRKKKHTVAQASTVVALNNVLGFAGHGLLIVLALLFFAHGTVTDQQRTSTNNYLVPGIMLGTAILLVVLAVIVGRKKFVKGFRDIVRQIASYRKRPKRLTAALLCSMTLTLCNVLCLMCCALALGVNLSLVSILFIFSFGVGAGTATPTPGGLGGFEAGLVAGFVAYGVESSAALAVALLFRLISYWLALLIGGGAFWITQKRKLLTV